MLLLKFQKLDDSLDHIFHYVECDGFTFKKEVTLLDGGVNNKDGYDGVASYSIVTIWLGGVAINFNLADRHVESPNDIYYNTCYVMKDGKTIDTLDARRMYRAKKTKLPVEI